MAYATIAQLRQYLDQVADLGAQRVTLAGATGGTFTLTYEGATTAAIAYNATATVVKTALQALGALGSLVRVSGRPGDYLVRFEGVLASDAGPLTGSAALLTGSTPTITIASATAALLTYCLDRATDIVRAALAALLADPLFDYAAYGAATTRIVRGTSTDMLQIPAHQAGSVSLVEQESGSSPLTYTTIDAAQYDEEGIYLYRPGRWSRDARYRITAIWGYGATVPPAVEEVTLELAVNIYRSRDTGGFLETAGQDGPPAIRLVAGLTKLQQATLQNIAAPLMNYGV